MACVCICFRQAVLEMVKGKVEYWFRDSVFIKIFDFHVFINNVAYTSHTSTGPLTIERRIGRSLVVLVLSPTIFSFLELTVHFCLMPTLRPELHSPQCQVVIPQTYWQARSPLYLLVLLGVARDSLSDILMPTGITESEVLLLACSYLAAICPRFQSSSSNHLSWASRSSSLSSWSSQSTGS